MKREELDQRAWEAGLHLMSSGRPLETRDKPNETIFDEGYRVAEAFARTQERRWPKVQAEPQPQKLQQKPEDRMRGQKPK